MISRFLPKSGFARNVLTLFTGSTIAQAIPVLVSPILTRIYPVSDFAILTVVATLISLLGVIVTGRYEVGVGLPKSDKEARQLVYLSIIISFAVSLLAFILLLFWRYELADLLNNRNAANYLLVVPVTALVYGFNQALSYWNIRLRNFAQMAGSRVTQSIVNSGVSLGAGFAGVPFNGLVAGNVSGFFAALGYTLLRLIPQKTITFKREEFHRTELRALSKKYSDLPRVNGIHALSDMMQSTLQVFIISAFFGSLVVGLYGLTMRILQAPLNMIGNSISIVFYKEVSEKISRKEKITKLLRTTLRTLTLISLPVFLVIMILGPEIFAFVFGEEWRDAGVYARILSPGLFLNFISSPVSHLPVILNKQRQFFLFSFIGNVIVVAALLCGGLFFDNIQQGLMLVSAAQVIFQGCMIYFFIHISHKAETISHPDLYKDVNE